MTLNFKTHRRFSVLAASVGVTPRDRAKKVFDPIDSKPKNTDSHAETTARPVGR